MDRIFRFVDVDVDVDVDVEGGKDTRFKDGEN